MRHTGGAGVSIKISTVEQARALPEISSDLFFGGRLSSEGIDGDSIILFIDADGRSMTVVDTENGPAKMAMLL